MDRSEIMSKIRGKNTKPELILRKLLREAGHPGYRLHWGEYHIDVAYPGRKIAIFYDSCFWHGCPEHFRMPKTNAEFWRRKFDYRWARSRHVTEALKNDGWRVVRIWGHDLPKLDAVTLAELAGLSKKRIDT